MRSALGGRQVISTALAWVALLGAACSNNEAKSQNGTAEPAKSAIHGLRLLPNAVGDPESSTPGHEVYLVSTIPPENIVTIYRGGVAPAGANETLDVCSEKLTPPYELTWRVGDTNDFVVVQVEGDGAVDQPGSILTIIDDKANTTRTCDAP